MKLRLFGKEKGHTFVAGFGKHWLPMACDGMRPHPMACVGLRWHTTASDDLRWHTLACDSIRWHAMACDRIQSHTVVSVANSEDETEHLCDSPRYHANHREDGMRHCIEQHEEKTKYHHSILDFQFNLRPLTKPDSTYKVTKKI